ncbi:hypothetical protein GCM10027160_30010 [Streptomyces calidiresistens]|uniref:Uncharacterized protein n=1 Tax=Streptomyces calidiresistens TaxID=1485586 RepID=A0A7W3T1Y6_9ACTN|nr:hypothetical protein [Streptomyces calidiresistens]MBB0229333.1 hypothetical protein [Streptomyces calidiresistens]
MGFTGETWRMVGEREPVGEILIEDADFPWLAGRFTPGPGFAAVRPLFERELALTEADHEEGWAEWERVRDEIERRVTLWSPSGPVAGFLLHIDGERAWFRWSDEPLARS